ncbi:hypothetical protein L2K70_04950 [Nocardioides KLBMP 9356]|uniref:Uncharacterized protein n=1 Tax=Nocardioides potassii TaxID=2911371 RepID=A0ABS9HAA2_9ACTN|nr:hypothetical protein [Nocardioides potassii]MCF6376943.1 hypothetical protein [Nocardioides potassii]
MTPRLGLRLLALALPALLLAPGAAHARTLTVADSTSDAKALDMALLLGEFIDGTPAEGPYFLDAPDETSVDVVSTTIDHAAKRLTLTVQLRGLVELKGLSADFRIFTPDSRWDLSATYAEDGAQWVLFPGRDGDTIYSSEGSVTAASSFRKCRVRVRYDAPGDTVIASVPTACLGKPQWVQVSAGVMRTRVAPVGDGSANVAAFADDAFRGGLSLESQGRSPKVRRG